MKDSQQEVEVDGKKYLLAFNLNVLKALQNKYGSIKEFDTQLRKSKDGINADAAIFCFREMINEGIDIKNDDAAPADRQAEMSERQVGRLITKLGLGVAGGQIKAMFVAATQDPNPKNA